MEAELAANRTHTYCFKVGDRVRYHSSFCERNALVMEDQYDAVLRQFSELRGEIVEVTGDFTVLIRWDQHQHLPEEYQIAFSDTAALIPV